MAPWDLDDQRHILSKTGTSAWRNVSNIPDDTFSHVTRELVVEAIRRLINHLARHPSCWTCDPGLTRFRRLDPDDEDDFTTSYRGLSALYPAMAPEMAILSDSGHDSSSQQGSGSGSGSGSRSGSRRHSRKRKPGDVSMAAAASWPPEYACCDATNLAAVSQPPEYAGSTSHTYNMVDVFAGISSFGHTFSPHGFRPVGHCEINPLCNQILASCWPTAEKCEDFYAEHWKSWKLSHVDLLCGGPSCVSFSPAGKQLAAKDVRHSQLRDVAHMAAFLNVRICLLENVVQFLDYKEVLDAATDLFTSLGYSLKGHFICRHSQLGGASMRQRVIFFFEQDTTMAGLPPVEVHLPTRPHTPLKDLLLTTDEVYEARVYGHYEVVLAEPPAEPQPSLVTPTIMGYLHVGGPACEPEWGSLVSLDGRGRWRVMSIENGTIELLLAVRSNPRRKYVTNAGRLRCLSERIPVYSVEGLCKSCRAFGEPPVLTCMLILDPRFPHDDFGLLIRRLLPEEVWRIQQLPHHVLLKARSLGAADSQIYRLAGNSIPPSMLEPFALVAKHRLDLSYGLGQQQEGACTKMAKLSQEFPQPQTHVYCRKLCPDSLTKSRMVPPAKAIGPVGASVPAFEAGAREAL